MAWTLHDGEPLRISQARVLDQSTSAAPGVVLAATNTGVDVATGAAILRITELQPAGRRVMSAGDFVRGRTLAGVRLGR